MKFKNQQEIWKHLVDGGKIKSVSSDDIIYFVDGSLKNQDGYPRYKHYIDVDTWLPYQDPIEFEAKVEILEPLRNYDGDRITLLSVMPIANEIEGKRFKVTMCEIVGEG